MIRQYKTIYYDIVGVCNAKCPYCLSGRYKTPGGKIVTPEAFSETLDVICNNHLLADDGVLGLYNWGEPFLHPRLSEIVQITNEHQLHYGFSTNASKVPVIDDNFVYGLKYIVFSMPGFSQKSYDRIHVLDFQKVLYNMRTIVGECRQHGFAGSFSISYHIYQFNLGEMFMCAQFAREMDISFNPRYAILNNWDHANALIDNTLDPDIMRNISEELFNFNFRELISTATQEYDCPQFEWLAIDEFSNALQCCQVPPGIAYSPGNLRSDDVSEILERRCNSQVCKECIGKGLAYYLNNSLVVPEFYTEAIHQHELLTQMAGGSNNTRWKKLVPSPVKKAIRRLRDW